MLLLGTLSFGFWILSVDSAFIIDHQRLKYSQTGGNEFNHLSGLTDVYFVVFITEHTENKFYTNSNLHE